MAIINGTDYSNDLIGTEFDDLIRGFGGDDYLAGEGGDDTLKGGDGEDFLEGGADNDILRGATGGDRLFGGAGDDELYGGADNDWLDGGSGADLFKGAGGFDIVSYFGSDAGVTVDLAAGTATGGDATGDVILGVEGVAGSELDDILYGNGKQNYLGGGDGDDLLKGRNGDDWLSGDKGADKVVGGNGDDMVTGEFMSAERETLGGSISAVAKAMDDQTDILKGGSGADLYLLAFGGGDDIIRGFEPGVDRIDFTIPTNEDVFDPLANAAQNGEDVVIAYGDGDSVRLKDTNLDDLSSGDFDFVVDQLFL